MRDHSAEWSRRRTLESPAELEKRRADDRRRARRYRRRCRLARTIPLHSAFRLLATRPWVLE